MYWNKEGGEDRGSLIRKHTLFFTDMFLFSANHFFPFHITLRKNCCQNREGQMVMCKSSVVVIMLLPRLCIRLVYVKGED